jgi:Fe-S-cluster containining protein
MSLCDTCHSPGHCCKDFVLIHLGTFWEASWVEDARAKMIEHDLPFIPSRFIHADNPEPGHAPYGDVRFSCPRLGDDGRCTIYESRPQLCRSYEPATDALCVYFIPIKVERKEA